MLLVGCHLWATFSWAWCVCVGCRVPLEAYVFMGPVCLCWLWGTTGGLHFHGPGVFVLVVGCHWRPTFSWAWCVCVGCRVLLEGFISMGLVLLCCL